MGWIIDPISNAEAGAMNCAPTVIMPGVFGFLCCHAQPHPLGEIIRTYKAASTRMIRQTANTGFTWQRNYYEHIVRSDESLNRIPQYIGENPARWAIDRENPDTSNPEPENPWEGK